MRPGEAAAADQVTHGAIGNLQDSGDFVDGIKRFGLQGSPPEFRNGRKLWNSEHFIGEAGESQEDLEKLFWEVVVLL